MARFRTLGWILAIVAMSTCLPAMVEAGTVTGSPVGGYTTADSSKDQVLLSASPSFTADLSTYATFTGQAHSILGQTASDGISDLEHQAADGPDGIHGDISLPYAMVGRHANGENGTVLYKFVAESGYQTAAGGTISADVYFRHDPLENNHGYNAWIGVNPTASVPAGLGNLTNDVDFQRVNMKDRFGGAGYHGFDTYKGEVIVDIPAGLTEFYVAFSDVFNGPGTPPTHSSARFAVTSLQVNGNLVAIPEPGSLVLLGFAGIVFVSLGRRSFVKSGR